MTLTMDFMSTPPLSPPQSPSTNTLLLVSLPPYFFHPTILETLREHFAYHGELHTWAPLRGLRRVIIVFYDELAAETARARLGGFVIGQGSDAVTLQLYRGPPTPLVMEPSNLEVPRPEKNFLISPPGSPPVGWEPIEEDPPNTMTLAQDLIHALERLELQKEWGSDRSNGVEVLMQPPEGEEGLSIFVQDFSGGADQGDGMITPVEVVEYVRGGGQGSGIGMVKATVESFGVGERPSVGRLPTTPMPPR